MKQLDLFLDTDYQFYEEMFDSIGAPDEAKKTTIEELIKWRASELNLSLEEYSKWIKKDYNN